MKKPANAKIKAARQSSAKTGKKRGSPIFDLLTGMDDDTKNMLTQALQREMRFDPAMLEMEGVVDRFRDYIESCAQADSSFEPEFDDEGNAMLAELVSDLDDLRIDSNGGNAHARRDIKAIYDILDHALATGGLQAVSMMLTAKLLADAGWDIPERLKQAVAETLSSETSPFPVHRGQTIMASLLEIAEQTDHNPFDIHDHVKSMLAGFPTEVSAGMLSGLIEESEPIIDQALAGFILHPDASIAEAVMTALTTSAKTTPVASTQISRLVLMRPWLPLMRQIGLDATLRAMRLNALPPVPRDVPKTIKNFVSICDGSGTRSLIVTQRTGKSFQIATVMMKATGAVEAMVLPHMPKAAQDEIIRGMKSSMPTSETSSAGIEHTLALALADNAQSGHLPPFRLVEVLESLDIGTLLPDASTPLELITRLLADVPAAQTSAAALAGAHRDILDHEIKYQWFETGEAIETMLAPVKGYSRRVAKLMKEYLPDRRQFWARQCALSADALRGDGGSRQKFWIQLALVGRELATSVPLEQIPLMKSVAEGSVEAFEYQQ